MLLHLLGNNGKAMDECYETGRYMRVQLHPMRIGADLWRQYVVKFDGATNEVVIVINEIVTTSQVPYLGTEPKVIYLKEVD